MDSSAAHETIEESMNDDDTDYGSDFSPEEERILAQLLSGQQQADIEDNPIATEAVNGDGQALRLPRVLGRESRSPLLQAVVAAEELAQQISNSVKNGHYPDCKRYVHCSILTNLTDAQASSEQ
jgi:exonuclease V